MDSAYLQDAMPLFEGILAFKTRWARRCPRSYNCTITWAVDRPGVPQNVRDELPDLRSIADAALLAKQYMQYERSLQNATSRLARNDLERRCADRFAQLTRTLRRIPDMDFSAMNRYYLRILAQLDNALSRSF